MPFGKVSTPVQWEEDGYTVTRTNSWSAPGDHPTGAGMKLYVKDGILEKVEGDPEHSILKGALPIRMLALPEYVYNPDRITYPMKRDPKKRGDNTAWERISWDEAYDMIVNKVNEYTEQFNSNTIITFVGTGREAGNWGPTISCRVFNSPNICYMQSGWSCYGPRMAVTSYVLGAPYPEVDYAAQFPDSYDDPRYQVPECVLLWGKEPLKSNPDGFWGHSLVDMMKRGTKFITVDPRLTFEAANSEFWLQPRPGTDTALAMAMLNVIINEELYDHDFVENWTFGFEEFAKRIQDMPPAKAAEICGIPEEKIIGAARFFAKSKPGAVQWGLAIDQNPNGVQLGECLIAIMAICGCIDVPGGNVMGAIDIGGLGSGYSDLNPQDKINEQIGVDEFPALVRTLQFTDPDSVLDQLESGTPFKLKMGFFTSANAIANPCNVPKRWENALNTLEFNVATDLFMTPTISATCDLFLPVATYAERDMYVATHYGAVGLWIGGIKKAITVGEAKSDVEILRTLGKKLRPELWQYDTDVEYINDQKLKTLGITMEDLWEHGWWHVDYEYQKYAKGKLRADGIPGFMTPTGKIELYSTMIEAWGDDPMPYYKEPPTSPVSTPEYAAEYPLVLSTGQRTWSYFHSEGRQVPKWREVEPDPLVEINPKDAKKYGIIDGDWVWLENSYGKCKMKASVQPGQKEGSLAAQHGWWYPERDASAPELFGVYEVNVNNLTPYKTVGILGFGAPYKCLMCKIYKA
ncbi:molybdopterin-dependent oxidoreductase [Dehalobacter sp. DCM]|uniref:molybdopterin-dependent oxidoreductase n=1 Tax=Dehalobacter sp. DCM TaxID=2907827 RepID=UPI0030816840|nr:molybdopterin-dependent oxidoreductase [Dehalobacter sp. DCM]